MRSLRFIVCSIVIAFFGSPSSIGQATFGVISGSVTDSTGAALVGATVSVQRIEGGDIKVAASGPTGDYRVEALTPGTYRVKVTAEHFSVTELSKVEVNASVTTPVNVRLSVGSTTETVTVDASVQQVQTDNGQIDAVIPTTQIRDLPRRMKLPKPDSSPTRSRMQRWSRTRHWHLSNSIRTPAS